MPLDEIIGGLNQLIANITLVSLSIKSVIEPPTFSTYFNDMLESANDLTISAWIYNDVFNKEMKSDNKDLYLWNLDQLAWIKCDKNYQIEQIFHKRAYPAFIMNKKQFLHSLDPNLKTKDLNQSMSPWNKIEHNLTSVPNEKNILKMCIAISYVPEPLSMPDLLSEIVFVDRIMKGELAIYSDDIKFIRKEPTISTKKLYENYCTWVVEHDSTVKPKSTQIFKKYLIRSPHVKDIGQQRLSTGKIRSIKILPTAYDLINIEFRAPYPQWVTDYINTESFTNKESCIVPLSLYIQHQ